MRQPEPHSGSGLVRSDVSSLFCVGWHFGLGHLGPFLDLMEEDGRRRSRTGPSAPVMCCPMRCLLQPVLLPLFRTPPAHIPEGAERVSVRIFDARGGVERNQTLT